MSRATAAPSQEIPLLTAGTTISSEVINVHLDIADQAADVDEHGTPRPGDHCAATTSTVNTRMAFPGIGPLP